MVPLRAHCDSMKETDIGLPMVSTLCSHTKAPMPWYAKPLLSGKKLGS
jgi:hypothetical protein